MQTVSRIEKETRKRNVLVVEDEKINRMMLGHILKDEYEVSYAENGKEALEIIKRDYKTLSIILTDIMMPVMDGYELLEILSQDKLLRNIPVIVLTSEKSAEIKSLQMGAVDFIPKPYDLPDVIKARIRRSIKLAEENTLLRAVENDELTGLYNKEFFYQYSLEQDRFHTDLDTDMVVINVNRFHIINELYGHKGGDELLRSIAEVIRMLLKKTRGLACRSDSDRFYVYYSHQDDYEGLLGMFMEELEKSSGLSGVSLRVGVYEHCDKSLPLDIRIDKAASACSSCRGTYASSFSIYDKELSEKELFAERLIRETDKAIEEKQFVVYYQPKYNIEGDTPVMTSAEALIRWIHPEFGRISPGIFIPLFEENGLIQKLDYYVWDEAARQIAKWKKELGVNMPVSVNVSRVDMFDPELEKKLLDIVSRHGLTTKELMLEVTESAYTESDKRVLELITSLREDGFIIEMDDFGSGYSSLNMISRMPIDILKLDMGFVRKMCSSEKDTKMVGIILEIAKIISVPVVAEGVETEEQYSLLKDMGCQVIQGYYFSQPLPPEKLTPRLLGEV